MNKLIVIAGASGGGKTTHSDGYMMQAGLSAQRVSCATFLKTTALQKGWSGLKDIEGRMFLQNLQYDLKAKYGDNIFAKRALLECTNNYKRGVDTCVIDDHRFVIERMEFQNWSQKKSNKLLFVKFYDQQAEERWLKAFLAGEEWAKHPSELEWRVLPDSAWDLIYINNRANGVDLSVETFNKVIQDTWREKYPNSLEFRKAVKSARSK